MREIINGIFYVMRSGCPWRLLPSDLPPWSTIYRWFAKFRDEDRFAKINHALVMFDRDRHRSRVVRQLLQVRWPIACVPLQRGVDRQARHRVAAPTRTAPHMKALAHLEFNGARSAVSSEAAADSRNRR